LARFIFSENYDEALERIEDHILLSTGDIDHVGSFLDEHDQVLAFIDQNPHTPAIHPVTGDQSWVFGNGRYRLFFKAITKKTELVVYLTHVIDNRQANLEVYPQNTIPTYDEE
jgi:hypothetical protein